MRFGCRKADGLPAAETGIRMTAREKILQIGQSCRSCLRLITVIIRWQTAIFNMASCDLQQTVENASRHEANFPNTQYLTAFDPAIRFANYF